MNEKKVVAIFFVIFLIAGLGVFIFSNYYTDFNFYESEITIQGKIITEKLNFKPDKPYHTLYRNFEDPIFVTTGTINQRNYFQVSNVECSNGEAYVRDYYGKCTYFSTKENSCLEYTENNEYGCGFGNTYGFNKEQEYWVQSTYEVYPENIFIINGNKYIKFIAYSSDNHPRLNKNNFKVNGEVIMKDSYSVKGDVIIYIPYGQAIPNANTLYQKNFKFDDSILKNLIFFILCIIPSFFAFGYWYFFGKEHVTVDIPKELSVYPNERRPWMIAAYFNPPFKVIDKNFFSAMLMDFYHKKIIDIKMKKKVLWIKINKHDIQLDTIERNFLAILEDLKHKKLENGYFNLKKDLSSFKNQFTVKTKFKSLENEVKIQGKGFIDKKGSGIILGATIVFIILLQIPNLFLKVSYLSCLYFLLFLIIGLSVKSSSLFMRFKESYYPEYQKWQAFKKYLSHSFSITHRDHEGIKMWDHYLVYATALGVAKKVLKEMKRANVIDQNHYNIYTGVYISSASFAASSGTSGGAGGAGAGGVGGGGGGGR